MGEGIAVVWPGATTRAFMGLPSGRPIPIKEEDPALLRSRIPEIELLSVEYAKYVPSPWARRASTRACAASTPSSARCGTSTPSPAAAS